MACMCGDYRCWSCGPAQGNWQCPICRAWADEPCEHMDPEGQGLKEEFKALAEQKDREQSEAEEAMAAEWEADKRFVALHPDWFGPDGRYRG